MMFSECKSLAELNQARVEAIKQGTPAVLVNKAYARKKMDFIKENAEGFKKLRFYPVPVTEQPFVTGIDYAFEESPGVLVVQR